MSENVPQQLALALPDPAEVEVAQVAATAQQIELWAEECASVDLLTDAQRQLSDFGAYFRRRNRDAAREIARVTRRVEERLGELLGPVKPGARTDLSEPSLASEGSLSANERSQFRKIAEHAEEPAVKEAIEAGESRAKVLAAIPPPVRKMTRDQKIAAAQRQLRTWIKEAEVLADRIGRADPLAWKKPFDEWAAAAGAALTEAAKRKGK